MGDPVTAATIGAIGAVIVALIQVLGRKVRRVEEKIDGLRNGTYTQAKAAITELQRERSERELMHLPLRRKLDRMIPEDHTE